MNDLRPEQTDWVNVAADVEVRSLWDSLHDSTLLSCQSDLLARTVALRFASGHLMPDKPNATFEFVLSAVTSSRATLMARWPGEYVRREGLSREQEEPLLKEYWSKWREQSLGWPDFEAALRHNSFDVGDAALAMGRSTRALKVSGMLDGDTVDDLYCCLCIAFESLTIKGPDNAEMTLEEFEQLGVTYWDEFERRAPRTE